MVSIEQNDKVTRKIVSCMQFLCSCYHYLHERRYIISRPYAQERQIYAEVARSESKAHISIQRPQAKDPSQRH